MLLTVQNRLSSLAKAIAKGLEDRLKNIKDHESAELISTMGQCLDIEKILETGLEDEVFNEIGDEKLQELLMIAKYDDEDIRQIKQEFKEFKERLCTLHTATREESDLLRRYEHLIYNIHDCSQRYCQTTQRKKCKESGNLLIPKIPKPIKFLHIFMKEMTLYQGVERFLHFLLRCSVKTHAEGVAESMGNYIEMHSEKRRGLDIEDVGVETFIHWNGPPVSHANTLLTKALNRHFRGDKWNFITRKNKLYSTVTERLLDQKPRVPFF